MSQARLIIRTGCNNPNGHTSLALLSVWKSHNCSHLSTWQKWQPAIFCQSGGFVRWLLLVTLVIFDVLLEIAFPKPGWTSWEHIFWPKNVFPASLVDVQYLFKSVPALLSPLLTCLHIVPRITLQCQKIVRKIWQQCEQNIHSLQTYFGMIRY